MSISNSILSPDVFVMLVAGSSDSQKDELDRSEIPMTVLKGSPRARLDGRRFENSRARVKTLDRQPRSHSSYLSPLDVSPWYPSSPCRRRMESGTGTRFFTFFFLLSPGFNIPKRSKSSSKTYIPTTQSTRRARYIVVCDGPNEDDGQHDSGVRYLPQS